MPGRHYLEEALQKSIEEKNLKSAKIFIETIQEIAEASLTSLDSQDKSFLFVALEVGLKEIVDILIEIQKDDDILFNADKNRSMLIHVAAVKGHVDVVDRLLNFARIKNKPTIFFQKDSDGCTALHKAASSGHEEIVKLLLEYNKENDLEFVNLADKDGNTASHKALEIPASRSIEYLINNGASLELQNNKRITSFALLCEKAPEIQLGIFRSVHPEKQNYLLQLYRKLLIKNPTLENIKDIYFKFSGLHGLKSLLIAHHEFNQDIPIKNYYVSTQRMSDVRNPDGACIVQTEEKYINSDILKIMPLYADQVYLAEENGEKQIEENLEVNNKPVCEAVSEDRGTLTELIEAMENYLVSLQGRSVISINNRALAILIPTVNSLIFVGLESWFVHSSGTISRDDDYDKWNSYLDRSIGFGILGGFATAINDILTPMFLWNKEINVSRSEWKALIDTLQHTILEKLQHLEKIEKGTNLPTSQKNIRDLENKIYELGHMKVPLIGDISARSQPITKVIDIFTRLKNIVETVRFDLNRTNTPISLLFKETAIKVNEINDNFRDDRKGNDYYDDPEKEGLLKYHNKR